MPMLELETAVAFPAGKLAIADSVVGAVRPAGTRARHVRHVTVPAEVLPVLLEAAGVHPKDCPLIVVIANGVYS